MASRVTSGSRPERTVRCPRSLALCVLVAACAGAPATSGRADPKLEARIRALLEAKVAARAFPGAAAMVTRGDRVLARVAVGHETYAADAPPIRTGTRFDLASLTKVCATLPALAVLFERGSLAPDDRLKRWVPEFHGPGKDAVTLRHLMTHSAGLPAYVRFYRQGLRGKPEFVAACAATGLAYAPGAKSVYSDLGAILLMAVVERASGRALDEFLRDEVYPELGVEARFAAVGRPIDAAPTEDDPWRQRVVRGEVHDENAFAMGGVSGHAGLFGTVDDVARIGRFFLRGHEGLLSAHSARAMTKRDGSVAGSTRALLWDTFEPGGSGGSKLSPLAFGHTGFTGTSIWCDPRDELCMVLLTNRVHPTRANRAIVAARREFHDLVVTHVRGR